MKKYLFLLATLMLTMSMSVSAQNFNNRRNAGHRQHMDNRRSQQMMRMTPQERVDLMTKELNLTDKESAQVLELCKKQEAERTEQVREHRSQRGMGSQNRAERREEMRKMRDEQREKHYAQLEKIIGKEKAEKWDEIREDFRANNRSGRMHGRGRNINSRRSGGNRRNNSRSDMNMRWRAPQSRVDLMTKELDLTDKEASQVLDLLKKHDAERTEQIREYRSQSGANAQNREERRDEILKMREDRREKHQDELEKIIGEEKVEKWYEIRQEARESNRANRNNPRYRNE